MKLQRTSVSGAVNLLDFGMRIRVISSIGICPTECAR